MNILSLPTHVCRIGDEVNFHGSSINNEITHMRKVIDANGGRISTTIEETGSDISREIEHMRQELVDLKKTAKKVFFITFAVNIFLKLTLRC